LNHSSSINNDKDDDDNNEVRCAESSARHFVKEVDRCIAPMQTNLALKRPTKSSVAGATDEEPFNPFATFSFLSASEWRAAVTEKLPSSASVLNRISRINKDDEDGKNDVRKAESSARPPFKEVDRDSAQQAKQPPALPNSTEQDQAQATSRAETQEPELVADAHPLAEEVDRGAMFEAKQPPAPMDSTEPDEVQDNGPAETWDSDQAALDELDAALNAGKVDERKAQKESTDEKTEKQDESSSVDSGGGIHDDSADDLVPVLTKAVMKSLQLADPEVIDLTGCDDSGGEDCKENDFKPGPKKAAKQHKRAKKGPMKARAQRTPKKKDKYSRDPDYVPNSDDESE
jgi:hypothetical protein